MSSIKNWFVPAAGLAENFLYSHQHESSVIFDVTVFPLAAFLLFVI